MAFGRAGMLKMRRRVRAEVRPEGGPEVRAEGGFRLKSSSEHLGPWLDWVCPVDAPEYFCRNSITNTKYTTVSNTNRDRRRKYPHWLLLFIRPCH